MIEKTLARIDLEKAPKLKKYRADLKKEEGRYHHWCISNRLFLNPINDIGKFQQSATDNLMIPSITTSIDEGPSLHGFFNQLKQEYVSARYMYYEGMTRDAPHFSDMNVLLVNTMDYPAYSFAVEQIKATFRISYSLLDKIAFFLNKYFNFGIPERQVSFRSLWYKKNQKIKELRPELSKLSNWPLRGLFWLTKDIFESKPDLQNSTDPRAETLAIIRNFVEHKYFKLHDGMIEYDNVSFDGLSDRLAFSLSRSDFNNLTLQLLKISRSALIYLCLALFSHEIDFMSQKPEEIILPLFLDKWEDHWKT